MGRGIMRKLGFAKEITPEDVEKFNKLRKNLPDLAEAGGYIAGAILVGSFCFDPRLLKGRTVSNS